MPTYHDPVLCDEAMGLLLTTRDGVYVDLTVGGGGHAERVCEHLSKQGQLIGFDADEDAIRAAGDRLSRHGGRVDLIHANFRFLARELAARGINGVAGMLFDLGVSSHQLDAVEKGFSFRTDERLDMRMDSRQPLSAWEVVNGYPEQRLAVIFREYGEERESARIARAIAQQRPVETTEMLSRIVAGCVNPRFLTKSLARVFQALRIEVNRELESLRRALECVPDLLLPGGRCVVISYHSLEDRIVKEFFRAEAAGSIPSTHKYLPDTPRARRLEILTRKPVTASEDERVRNPRARSAKLRAAARPMT